MSDRSAVGAPVTSFPVLDFRILGPLRVLIDGADVPIATRRQRALLVLLLMNVGRTVPSERLIDQLWDGAAPPQAAVTLRSYVSNLRQALRAAHPDAGGVLVTRGSGYCLDVPRTAVDAVRLTTWAEDGRQHLRAGKPSEALTAFQAAVDLWTDDPLAEIADHEIARSTITHLTETYLGAAEGRFQALVDTGRHLDAIPALDAFATEHPLREEPHALLMVALYRSGRAPEALEVHRRFRARLQDELGIDPSARLDELTTRILSQDPQLQGAPAVVPDQEPPDRADPRETPAEEARGTTPRARVVVGRRRERAALGSHLERLTREGVGALVLIGGEPGIGKSTLLEALDQEAARRGVSVHHGRSPAAGGAPPFWPWSQVVESLASRLDDDRLRAAARGPAMHVARLSASVSQRTGVPDQVMGDNPQAQRFVLYEAVSSFIRQATSDGPVVITLDDIHWADLPSLELLSYLTPTLASRPLLLAATYRNLPAEWTEELVSTLATVSREDVVEELSLGGLAAGEVAELAGDLLPSQDVATRASFADLLHSRTGGNPFFVRQLGRLMIDAGESAADPSTVPVPAGVRHVIASRLAQLSPAAGRLLEAAAVIGREFDLSTAARAAGLELEEAMDSFDLASSHGLVEDGGAAGGRRFVHTLVQEVVRDGLPAGRAARLHADVAALLQRDGGVSADELAGHLWAARDIAGRAAVPVLQAAADAASAVFAHEQTELHLRRALSIVRVAAPAEAETELTILLGLFRLVVSARGWGDEDARAMVDRAMELADGQNYTDSSARLWWSLVFYLLDRDDPAYIEVATSLVDAGAHEEPASEDHLTRGPAARAAVHLMAIFASLARDDRGSAAEHLQRARALVELAPNAELAQYEEHLHVIQLLIEGYWAALHNDARTHRATTEAAVALADADGRPFPRAVARILAACSAAPYLDDCTILSDLVEPSLELTSRYGFGWLGALAEGVDGFARARAAGVPREGVEPLASLLESLERAGHHGNESLLLLMLARLHAESGDSDAAAAALSRARTRPGPYAGLVVDVVDRRLSELAKSDDLT